MLNQQNSKTFSSHVGEKIRTFRIVSGLTQEDLGKKIGVTFQQIQKYEKGQNNISLSRLHNIALAMNIDIVDFFHKEELLSFGESQEIYTTNDQKISSKEIQNIVKAYSLIQNESSRKKLLSLIKTMV